MEQRFGTNRIDIEMLREFCEREGEVVTYRKGVNDNVKEYQKISLKEVNHKHQTIVRKKQAIVKLQFSHGGTVV